MDELTQQLESLKLIRQHALGWYKHSATDILLSDWTSLSTYITNLNATILAYEVRIAALEAGWGTVPLAIRAQAILLYTWRIASNYTTVIRDSIVTVFAWRIAWNYTTVSRGASTSVFAWRVAWNYTTVIRSVAI